MDTISHCIEALSGAMMLTAQAIQVEIAVSFVIFYEQAGTNIAAKRVLRQVYASAGRVDCLTSGTGSYMTVTRRMGRSAAFYDSVGARKVKPVINGKRGKAAIEAVIAFLKPYGIETMDDLAARAGRQRKPSAEAPGTVHIKTDHCRLDLAPDATIDELHELRDKLDELIAEREARSGRRRKSKSEQLHH